jgi:hypothetical protein
MISKTDFIQYIQHPCLLWLSKNQRESLPSVSDNLKQLYEDGRELEKYAEARYSNIIRGALPSEPGRVGTQCTIVWEDFECRVDLLEVLDDGAYHLIEVKSSTKAKPLHIYDLAFQRHVLTRAGYEVGRTSVMYVSNEYVRNGDIDHNSLLALTDVTANVLAVANIEPLMLAAVDTANLATMPSASPRHAHREYKSDWLDIARPLMGLPEYCIYDMPYLSLADAAALEDAGILSALDIPVNRLSRADQKRILENLRLQAPVVELDGISSILQELKYPLHFLDYESISLPVPAYDGTKPYQQVVFQYSLHVLDHPDAEPQHFEYLHLDPTHPTKPLTAALQRDMRPDGSVIVWNETFEKTRNKEMGFQYVDSASFYESLNDRMFDLMSPFKKDLYRDARFLGSASIKRVLPVLVPGLTYTDLEVQEGQSASRLWRNIVLDGSDMNGRSAEVLIALREYCRLDTHAMVAIYRALCQTVAQEVLADPAT